jgi:hypothetical protein
MLAKCPNLRNPQSVEVSVVFGGVRFHQPPLEIQFQLVPYWETHRESTLDWKPEGFLNPLRFHLIHEHEGDPSAAQAAE